MEQTTLAEQAPPKKTSVIEDVEKLREELKTGLQACMDELDLMKAMRTTPPVTISSEEPTIDMLACGQLLCPKCNLMLEGFSPTGERTLRFTHPFAQSPKLGGKQCEYSGWVFTPPKISLKVLSKPVKRV